MTTKAEFRADHGRPFGEVVTRTPSGLCLHRDNKTSSLSKRRQSGVWEAMIPNALPLPAGPTELGGTCPGATGSCTNCYALHGLEWRDSFARLAAENLRVLQAAHEEGRLVDVLLEAVDLSARSAVWFRREPTFRWHSDGDVFAPWYARAIREVAKQRPWVSMWIYTRSFRPGASYLGALVGPARPENLHVFLSVDRHNVTDAVRQLARFERHGVRAAILAESDEERVELETHLGVTSIVCPATGRYAHDGHGPSFLTNLSGTRRGLREAEMAQGACNACGFCLRDDSRSVTFHLHGGQRSAETTIRIIARRPAA